MNLSLRAKLLRKFGRHRRATCVVCGQRKETAESGEYDHHCSNRVEGAHQSAETRLEELGSFRQKPTYAARLADGFGAKGEGV